MKCIVSDTYREQSMKGKYMTTIPKISLFVLALTCFRLIPNAQAVMPPPDGGYPGGNTAEGQNALLSLTTGAHNTAVGFLSLKSDTTGSYNTAIGSGALRANKGDVNTATGTFALLSNTIGWWNTANGALALLSNTNGVANTAVGYSALFSNTVGLGNTAVGDEALVSNITGDANIAIGTQALDFNTTGGGNTGVGEWALYHNTSGVRNIALGFHAGEFTTGSDNMDIGNVGVESESNTIRIGTQATHTATYIAGINTTTVTGTAVQVTADGQLGTVTSSERFKKDIAPMEKTSEAILLLKPVTFHYKTDTKDAPQFGLIAEEVAEVNPALVLLDKEGKPYTVRYDAVNAMLLNEFLKEHKNVQELKATLGQQQKEIAALIAHIKEQDAKIQRVSDQLETNNAGSEVAKTK
jgi:lactam utilization protein B